MEECFLHLEAPVKRVCGYDTPCGVSQLLTARFAAAALACRAAPRSCFHRRPAY
jgi:pyruvate/2-oxoglutarate/acetoin dehydrogenase E1 component